MVVQTSGPMAVRTLRAPATVTPLGDQCLHRRQDLSVGDHGGVVAGALDVGVEGVLVGVGEAWRGRDPPDVIIGPLPRLVGLGHLDGGGGATRTMKSASVLNIACDE